MAGISSKAAGKLENHKKFVGQEFNEDFDIDLYEFKWRHHDPQIGRFIQIDPLANDYVYNSTYAYAENRPIDGIDLEGLEFTRTVEGKSITLSATTQSVNKTTMVSNDYINRVNVEVNRQMGELFNKRNSQTGNSYSANYNSTIVESGDYDNTIVAEFYNNMGEKNGDNGSNTQSGRIRVGVMEEVTMTDQDRKSTTYSYIRQESEVATTIIHEMLHGTGAKHVFVPNGNGVPADIAQYNSDGTRSNVPDETIKSNVLNSGANKDKKLANTDKRDNLSLGQIEAADARIKSEIDKKQKQ
jgi:RHS repeat-associated protein